MRPFVLLLAIVLSAWPAPVARAHSDRHVVRPDGDHLERRVLLQWLREVERIKAFQRRPGFILDVF